ncbi:MAG: hypothetical protein AB9907_05760 [Flexilinea sp.]
MQNLPKAGISFLLITLIFVLGAFVTVSAQAPLDGCYNEFRIERTEANSQASALCYTSGGVLTQISFYEFNVLNSYVIESTRPVQTEPVSPDSMRLPQLSLTQVPTEGSISETEFAPTESVSLDLSQLPQLSLTPVPTEGSISETEFAPTELVSPDPTQLSLTPVPTEGSISETEFAPTESVSPDPTQLPLTPVPTEEQVPEMRFAPMMMAVPMIGTLETITGKYPAEGDIYSTNNITFAWEFTTSGVETVPTSFTLTIDDVAAAVTPVCSMQICQVTKTLAAGNHSWFVMGQAGTSTASSSPINFKIEPAGTAPGTPVLISPTGDNWMVRSIDMDWGPAADAASYTVAWTSISGTETGSTTLPATDASCRSGKCSVPMNFPADGNYSWIVTAVNPYGTAVSTSMTFRIVPATVLPDKPVLEMPNTEYSSLSVNFVWKPANNATSYTVFWSSEWSNTGSITLSGGDASCMSGDCHVAGMLPVVGNYSWYVKASNIVGTVKSDTMSFSIKTNITTPGGISPSGFVNYRKYIPFVFTDVQDGTVEYNVRVYNTDNNELVLDNYWDRSQLNCSDGRCTGIASTPIPMGNYSWQVRARSSGAISNWSSALSFNNAYCYDCSINPPKYQTNTVPTPFNPIGLIQTASPTFSWRPITGAMAYWLTIYDLSGKKLYSGTIDNSICNYQICTFAPGFTLPAGGNYSWKISGGSSNGTVWGSSSANFAYQGITILADMISEEIRFVSPEAEGDLNSQNARIIWIDSNKNISSFKISILDAKGKNQLDTQLNRESARCDQTICTIEFVSIPPGEDYKIEITPVSTTGQEGKKAELTFNVTDKLLDFRALYPMEDEIAKSQILFSWRLPSGTAEDVQEKYTYYFRLSSLTENKDVERSFTCDSEALTCFNGGAFFMMDEDLPEGEYVWGVQLPELKMFSDPVPFSVKSE